MLTSPRHFMGVVLVAVTLVAACSEGHVQREGRRMRTPPLILASEMITSGESRVHDLKRALAVLRDRRTPNDKLPDSEKAKAAISALMSNVRPARSVGAPDVSESRLLVRDGARSGLYAVPLGHQICTVVIPELLVSCHDGLSEGDVAWVMRFDEQHKSLILVGIAADNVRGVSLSLSDGRLIRTEFGRNGFILRRGSLMRSDVNGLLVTRSGTSINVAL